MLTSYWQHFKSGTDIRGVALDGVEDQPLDLTDEVVEKLAAAFARWLSGKTGKPAAALTVSLGRDSRLSGPRLRDAVVRSLTARGVTVLDCGLASTPAMFMTTVDLGCDGAVQLTASHHPYHRNGLKFFLPSGGLEGADITALLELAQAEDFPPPAAGTVREIAYMTQYAARLRRLICEGVQAKDYNRHWPASASWWTRATARAASTPGTCWSPWAPTFPAANFSSRTAAFPTIFLTPRTPRPWPPSARPP